jgi:hypothetical protein
MAMSAADIAYTLGEARREGNGWRCRCPVHGGRSLVVRDGERGRLLVTCFGGCDRREVLGELGRRGLLDVAGYGQRLTTVPRKASFPRDDARTARALDIWNEARPIKGTPAERYLVGRGITPKDLPVETTASLRFHQKCPHPSGVKLPAMVARVERVGVRPLAIHRTYINADGSGKVNIDPAKASLGPVGSSGVRLGEPRQGELFVVAEGIESALSVVQACGLSGMAALSANGLMNLVLPPTATIVLICSDNDANGVGQRAARAAAERFVHEGRRVSISIPPMIGTDFNDVLRQASSAQADEEARHVA